VISEPEADSRRSANSSRPPENLQCCFVSSARSAGPLLPRPAVVGKNIAGPGRLSGLRGRRRCIDLAWHNRNRFPAGRSRQHRVVRTATADVDRRLNQRFSVDLACRVTADDQTHSARVVDWSDTGAQLRDAPTIATGGRGVLDVEGVGFPLPFIVRHDRDDSLHVAFTLNEANAVRFGGLPARLAGRAAA
jgi:hypothetical protein